MDSDDGRRSTPVGGSELDFSEGWEAVTGAPLVHVVEGDALGTE